MGIFSRFNGKRDDQGGSRARATTLSEQQLDELRETAREWIRSGFRDKVDLPTELADFRDDLDVGADVVLRAATGIVDEEWATRLTEQQQWSGDTDYDKVSRAFDALAGQGIVARMNFTCCQTCGTSEIDDERTPLPDPGDGYRKRVGLHVLPPAGRRAARRLSRQPVPELQRVRTGSRCGRGTRRPPPCR